MLNHQGTASPLLWLPLIASCASSDASPTTRAYADVNGLHLYYEIHGAPSERPPLVLIHGGGSSTETFAKAIPELARDRLVIAFDQQGHGRTADVDKPFSFEQSADDTAALMRALNIPKADFLGFSNGGSIALQLGIRHPALVHKLIVTSAMFKRDGLIPGFFDFMKTATVDTMPPVLSSAYLRLAPHPNLQSFFEKSRDRMLGFTDWSADAIRSIQAPTLVVVGDADVIRPEHAVEMFRLLPHGDLAILPKVDHAAMLDRPELVTTARAFLDAP